VHAVGFNASELRRIVRDPGNTKVPQRRPIFPVYDWGWGWDDCGDYLMRAFGVLWPKSRCRMCPFAGSKKRGWSDTLSMYMHYPEEAFQHIIDEHCTLSFNENSGIYAVGDSLGDRLRRDGADEVVGMAEREMDAMPWALYLVSRVYTAKAQAARLLVRLLEGPRPDVEAALSAVGAELNSEPVTIKGIRRVHVLARQENTFPCPEMFCVAAPAQARTKVGPRYPAAWRSVARVQVMGCVEETHTAIDKVRSRFGSRLTAVDMIPGTEEELASAQQTLV
jgi:hypothetical protein